MSPIDYSGGTLKAFGPKVGESKVIHIRESKRVESSMDDPLNFRSRTENKGYRYELTLTNGRIFMLNVWKIFFAFKDANVEDGDLVQIDHPGEGVYKVSVLEKGTGLGVVVEDTEKMEYEATKKAGGTVSAPPVAKVAPAVQPPVQATPPVKATPPVQATTPPAQKATDEGLDLPF